MSLTVPAFILAFGLAIMLPVTGVAPQGGVLFAVAGVVQILASRTWAISEHQRLMPGDPVLSPEQATRMLQGLHLLMGVGLIAAGAIWWRYGILLTSK
jgi:hypothetical protein